MCCLSPSTEKLSWFTLRILGPWCPTFSYLLYLFNLQMKNQKWLIRSTRMPHTVLYEQELFTNIRVITTTISAHIWCTYSMLLFELIINQSYQTAGALSSVLKLLFFNVTSVLELKDKNKHKGSGFFFHSDLITSSS